MGFDLQTVTALLVQKASFKSHLSIENIYPNSNPDYLRKKEQNSVEKKEEFSGYIPVDQLKLTYMRSSGPGGQNVNKVNSKVDMRFHLESANWLPDWIKARLA